MKIDRLIEMAREAQQNREDLLEVTTEILADGIVEQLGPALPCGMEQPRVVSLGNGSAGVVVDERGDALTVEEARGYAASVLRAADEAEELSR